MAPVLWQISTPIFGAVVWPFWNPKQKHWKYLNVCHALERLLWMTCENLETQVTYATQRENPGVGSKGEKPNNTKKPSTQTHSPSHRFQLLLQRTEGNNKVWACFLSFALTLVWTKLGSFWALRWKMRDSACISCCVSCDTKKKLSSQLLLNQKLISRQTHRKLVCTGCLFSICFKHKQQNSCSNKVPCK